MAIDSLGIGHGINQMYMYVIKDTVGRDASPLTLFIHGAK